MRDRELFRKCDRCRTTINVMGDMNVSCILDGRKREKEKTDRLLESLT